MFRLIVKRVYFDQIVSGAKTIEYRRHRPPYTAKNFFPGREFWLDWRHNHRTGGEHGLLVRCKHFEVSRFAQLDDPTRLALREIYCDLNNSDEIALIHLG